jgi:hypothetical protein
MDIIETDTAWRAVFFPDAEPTEFKDMWSDKGFRTQYAMQDGENVPQYIEYDKNRYTLEEAVAFAKQIKTCGRCKILNSAVDVLRTVKLKDNYRSDVPRTMPVSSAGEELKQLRADYNEMKVQLRKIGVTSPTRKSATQDLASNIAMDMFKTNFTEPGLIEMALIFDDDSFINDLLPENPTDEDLMELRAKMADFWAGDTGRYRDAKQLRQYAKMQRNNIKALRGEEIEEDDDDDEEDMKSVAVRRKRGKLTKVRVV